MRPSGIATDTPSELPENLPDQRLKIIVKNAQNCIVTPKFSGFHLIGYPDCYFISEKEGR
jgi:hypothetical protein